MDQRIKRFREWNTARTPEEIRLDFMNNFLTVEAMADYYGIDAELLRDRIKAAQESYRRLYEWKQKAKKFTETGKYY